MFEVRDDWRENLTDPETYVDHLTGESMPDHVHTGTPPPIGPGGSTLAGLGLRTRIAGALGFEAARSETGRSVLEGAGDVASGGSADSDDPGTQAGAAFAHFLSWLLDHGRAVLAGVVLLVVVYTVGNLFTFNVGVGDGS